MVVLPLCEEVGVVVEGGVGVGVRGVVGVDVAVPQHVRAVVVVAAGALRAGLGAVRGPVGEICGAN